MDRPPVYSVYMDMLPVDRMEAERCNPHTPTTAETLDLAGNGVEPLDPIPVTT
jgi:hypothetical protein